MRFYNPEWDDPRPRCVDCRVCLDVKPPPRYCDECQAKHDEFQKQMQDWMGYCAHCDGPIKATRRHTFCSSECAHAYRVDEAMVMAEHMAKLGHIGASTGWRRRLFGYLADRDGPACYLCRKDVDLAEKGDDGPSVDHVRPRAKGGTHDLSNLKLTHRICNTRKGAREIDEYHRRWG